MQGYCLMLFQKIAFHMSQYTCKVSFKEPVHSWAFPKERELLMTWRQGDLARLYSDTLIIATVGHDTTG